MKYIKNVLYLIEKPTKNFIVFPFRRVSYFSSCDRIRVRNDWKKKQFIGSKLEGAVHYDTEVTAVEAWGGGMQEAERQECMAQFPSSLPF